MNRKNFSKVLAPFFLLMVMASVTAAGEGVVTVTVNEPATGTGYAPNLFEADKCFDWDFNVLDTNSGAAVHTVSIQYSYGDNNTFVIRDSNLGINYCTWGGSSTPASWATLGGARCVIPNYCWATHDPVTGPYSALVDVNSYGLSILDQDADGNTHIKFSLDNRYISSSVEALVNVVPLVLVAAMIILVTMGLMGWVSPRTVIILLPGMIIVLISLLVIATLTGVMVANV